MKQAILNRLALQALLIIALIGASLSTAISAIRDEVVLYLNNGQGSAVATFDENASLCWEETFTPYGDKQVLEDSFQRTGCGTVAEERGFTGHVEDNEIDLVYMQQRYYDPTSGRFLSMDPVGLMVGDPRTINRYAYAANNPYKYIDPDGRVFFASNALRKDLTPEQALQISGMSTSALKMGAGSAMIMATVATPGPEDIVFAAGAFRGLSALKKGSEPLDDVPNGGQKLLASPRKHLLDTVSDEKLRKRVDALYRPNAKVGNGSTADAIRHELRTGELLSPSGHSKKGIEMRNGLLKDLKSGRLNDADSQIARDLVKDLQNALSGN